jgi:hypothetical protein
MIGLGKSGHKRDSDAAPIVRQWTLGESLKDCLCAIKVVGRQISQVAGHLLA